MATPSYQIMQKIAVIRAEYLSKDNFPAALATDLATDHSDALSKSHHETGEYYRALITRLEGLAETMYEGDYDPQEARAITRVLEEVVGPMYYDYLRSL